MEAGGGFGQPDSVGVGSVALVLSRNERSWGKKKRPARFKGGRPLGPVGATNRDQRVFRSGWCHQPDLKANPLVPVGASNRT